MRFLFLAMTVIACEREQAPAPRTEPTVSDPRDARGSATPDPWDSRGSSGPSRVTAAQEPIPKWANDPPHVLRDKINGVNAHVIVLKTHSEFPEYRDVLATVEKTPGVVAAEPFIFAELLISTAKHAPVPIALKAVDPKRVERVLALPSHMKEGKVASLAIVDPSSIILGDDVTLSPPPNPQFDYKPAKFRVTGTFHVDFDEYDERLVYVSLSAMQTMLGRGDQVMGIEMIVKDVDKSAAVATAIETALDGPYQAMDWYELNKDLFTSMYGPRRP